MSRAGAAYGSCMASLMTWLVASPMAPLVAARKQR